MSYGFYHSAKTTRPWYMVVLDDHIYLKKVIIYNRRSGQQTMANQFRDVSVRAGCKEPKPIDKTKVITENDECACYDGPAGASAVIDFDCTTLKAVKVITVQIINDNTSSILHFDEIELIEQSKFIAIRTKR